MEGTADVSHTKDTGDLYRSSEDYWWNKFSGELTKTYFPYDYKDNGNVPVLEEKKFRLSGDFFSRLMKLSGASDPRLHMILLTGLIIVLNKYTGSRDITVGVPVYKQDGGLVGALGLGGNILTMPDKKINRLGELLIRQARLLSKKI